MNVFIVVRIYDARDGCLHCNNARLMMIDNSFFFGCQFRNNGCSPDLGGDQVIEYPMAPGPGLLDYSTIYVC